MGFRGCVGMGLAGLVLALGGCQSQANAPRTGARSASVGPASVAPSVSLAGLGRLAWVAGAHTLEILDGGSGETRTVATAGNPVELAWSADGQWLGYLAPSPSQPSHEALWLVRADGGAPQPVRNAQGQPLSVSQFAWAPRGEQLAVVTDPPGRLWVASPQQAAVPISPPAVAVSSAVWNPAGTALAYGGGIKPSGGLARGVLLVVDPSGREVGPSLSATNAQYLLVRWLPTGILFWQDPYFSMSVAADGLTLYTWREGGGEAPKALAVTLPYASWVAPSADGTAVALVAGKGRETWLNKSVNLCTLPDGHCQRLGPSSNAAVALDPAVGPEGALWVEANRRSGGGWSSCSTPASCQNQGAQEAQAALQLQRWLQSRVLWWKPPGQVAREVAAAGSGIYDPEWAKGKPETILVKDGSLWLIDLSQGKLERLTGPLGGSGSPPAYGYYGHVGWDKLWAWYR